MIDNGPTPLEREVAIRQAIGLFTTHRVPICSPFDDSESWKRVSNSVAQVAAVVMAVSASAKSGGWSRPAAKHLADEYDLTPAGTHFNNLDSRPKEVSEELYESGVCGGFFLAGSNRPAVPGGQFMIYRLRTALALAEYRLDTHSKEGGQRPSLPTQDVAWLSGSYDPVIASSYERLTNGEVTANLPKVFVVDYILWALEATNPLDLYVFTSSGSSVTLALKLIKSKWRATLHVALLETEASNSLLDEVRKAVADGRVAAARVYRGFPHALVNEQRAVVFRTSENKFKGTMWHPEFFPGWGGIEAYHVIHVPGDGQNLVSTLRIIPKDRILVYQPSQA
jgi:hypothetical protein